MKDIRLLVMVAAPGVAAVNAAEPDVHIWACALDEASMMLRISFPALAMQRRSHLRHGLGRKFFMRDAQHLAGTNISLKLAFEVSKAFDVLRRAVGTIIVKDRRILATGYNGVPSGFLRHCEETGCCANSSACLAASAPQVSGLHAEQNASSSRALRHRHLRIVVCITTEPCSVRSIHQCRH